jgi:hypothetical protein
MDFSEDGYILRSTSSDGELAYWSVADKASNGYTVHTQRVDADGSTRIVGMDLLSHNDVYNGSAYTHAHASSGGAHVEYAHTDIHTYAHQGTRARSDHTSTQHADHADENDDHYIRPEDLDPNYGAESGLPDQNYGAERGLPDAFGTHTFGREEGHYMRPEDLDLNYGAESGVSVGGSDAPDRDTSASAFRSVHNVDELDQGNREFDQGNRKLNQGNRDDEGYGKGKDHDAHHGQMQSGTDDAISNRHAHIGGVHDTEDRCMYSNAYTWQVTATVSKLGMKNAGFVAGEHTLCGQRINCDSTVRDVRFASDTCPFGWSVRAIWRPRSDSRDLGAVARSEAGDVVACVYAPDVIGTGKVRVCMRLCMYVSVLKLW